MFTKTVEAVVLDNGEENLTDEDLINLETLSDLLVEDVVGAILHKLAEEVIRQSSSAREAEFSVFVNLKLSAVHIKNITLNYPELINRIIDLISKKVIQKLSDIISTISLKPSSLDVNEGGIDIHTKIVFCINTSLFDAIKSFFDVGLSLTYNLSGEFRSNNFEQDTKIINEINGLVSRNELSEYLAHTTINGGNITIRFNNQSKYGNKAISRDLDGKDQLLLHVAKMILAIRTYLKIDEFQSSQNPTIPIEN